MVFRLLGCGISGRGEVFGVWEFWNSAECVSDVVANPGRLDLLLFCGRRDCFLESRIV